MLTAICVPFLPFGQGLALLPEKIRHVHPSLLLHTLPHFSTVNLSHVFSLQSPILPHQSINHTLIVILINAMLFLATFPLQLALDVSLSITTISAFDTRVAQINLLILSLVGR